MTKLCPSLIRKITSTNKHYVKKEDVLCNPQNPVNPDSEPSVRGKYKIKTYREEDAKHRVFTIILYKNLLTLGDNLRKLSIFFSFAIIKAY